MSRLGNWSLVLALVLLAAVPAVAQLPYSASAVQIQNLDVAAKGKSFAELGLVLTATIPAGGADLDLECEAEAFDRGRGSKLRFIVEAAVADPTTGEVIQDLGRIKVKTKKRTGLGAKGISRISQDLNGQIAIVFAGRISGNKKADHAKFRCRLGLS